VAIAVAVVALANEMPREDAPIALAAGTLAIASAFLALGKGSFTHVLDALQLCWDYSSWRLGFLFWASTFGTLGTVGFVGVELRLCEYPVFPRDLLSEPASCRQLTEPGTTNP